MELKRLFVVIMGVALAVVLLPALMSAPDAALAQISPMPTPTWTPVPLADLRIEKSDSTDPVVPGEAYSYSVTVFNDGPSDAQAVVVADSLPAGVTFVSTTGCAEDGAGGGVPTCSLGSIATGDSKSYRIDVMAPSSIATATTITNNASVSSSTRDFNRGNNSTSENTTVVGRPDLRIVKDDLGVSVAAGDTLRYALTYINVGGADATGVVITDTVPGNTTFNDTDSTPGWSCVDGAPAGSVCVYDIGASGPVAHSGGGGQIDFAVRVDRPIAAGASFIINAAAIGDDGAGGADVNPGDNFDIAITPVIAAPDLGIKKDDGDVTARPGDTIRYTISFTNTGDQSASGVVLNERVPANTTFNSAASTSGWSCSGTVAGSTCVFALGAVEGLGGGGQVLFAVDVDSPFPAATTEVVNTVEIGDDGASGPDQNPGDNVASDTTPINQVPEITGISPVSQTAQYSDGIAIVTVSATDSGPDPLTLSTSALPNGLSLSAASCGAAAGGGVECTWTLSGQMLEAAGTYNIEVTASDGSLTSDPATITLVVIQEDATVSFDGSNPVAVPVDDSGNSEPFTLLVHVQETSESGAATAPGDINLAEVSITLTPVGPGSPITVVCASSGPVMAYEYSAVLTVSCGFSDVPVNTYAAEVAVSGGYYTGGGEDVLVVYDPSLGFTTGGGWFYWPGTSDRTNFGYTMKYNKKGTKPKGSLLLIRHLADGSIYRVKSNAIDGLALGDGGTFGWASFSGKSTYQEPGWAEPIGNHRFVVYVEDRDEHGTGVDRFWIEVDGGMSMSSPAEANAIEIEGGNIVVPHGGGGGRGRQ